MNYHSVFDLLFPLSCLGCGSRVYYRDRKALCQACSDKVKRLIEPLCVCCGCTLPNFRNAGNHWCGDCLRHPPFYSMARSLFCYESPIPDLLKRFKFNHDMVSFGGFAELLAPFCFADFECCDLILPIPLHVKRLRERGFNQSLLLAQLFFPNCLEKISPDILLRVRHTVPQTTLSGSVRRKNLSAAFSVSQPSLVADKLICLVDDVYTTGATVNQCSRALIEAGAREIRVVTLTRVVILK